MRRIIPLLAVCTATLVLTSRLHADVFLVTFESEVSGGGTLDWNSIGPANTVVSSAANLPTGIAGITANVSPAGGGGSGGASGGGAGGGAGGGSLARTTQGSSATDWNGNFAPGESLLSTSDSDPLRLDFSAPIQGIGAQIQPSVDGPFSATIDVYGNDQSLLNSFTVDGVSTNAGDNSAIFLGVSGPTNQIAAVDFSVSGVPPETTFAISSPEIQQHSNPEPSSLVIFGLGAGLAGLRYTGRRSRKSRRA